MLQCGSLVFSWVDFVRKMWIYLFSYFTTITAKALLVENFTLHHVQSRNKSFWWLVKVLDSAC